MDKDQLIEMREIFLTLAEITDELISLQDKESKGEKINEDEVNLLMGKYMTNIFKMQSIGEK